MSSWVDGERELRARARAQELRVLIWGPAPSGTDPNARRRYDKRLKFRETVVAAFPNAKVAFSEDDLLQDVTSYIRGQHRKEAVHAKLADLVVMLDISRGVDFELDHFVPTYPWFRDKVVVFLPEQFVSGTGLAREVLDYIPRNQVEPFSDSDFDACTLATQQLLRVVDAFAVNRFLQQ